MNELITSKRDEGAIEMELKKVRMVQPTKHQTTRPVIPAIEKFIVEQTKHAYIRDARTQVEMSKSDFHVRHNGLIVQKSNIHGCLQKVVPESRRERILHARHWPYISGHPGERRMYDMMRKQILVVPKGR